MKCQYCQKYYALENEKFCEFHMDLKLLTAEEIEKGHKCIRCPRLIFIENKRCG